MAVCSLPSRSDFDKVFKNPDAKSSNRDFLLLARINLNEDRLSRIGFVTPKKKLRRAVDRNRFRRVFREFLRASLNDISIDCVVIARSLPTDLHAREFQTVLARSFGKLFGKLKP
jgi:ribonuclease P protein component